LTVTLTPVNGGVPGTFQVVQYDFDGDGITDDTHNNLNPVTHTYSAAGQFFPVATVVTSAGKFSSPGGWSSPDPARLRINVQAQPVTLNTISITDPVDLKTSANGHLYVLSRTTATITEYDAAQAVVRSVSGIGTT